MYRSDRREMDLEDAHNVFSACHREVEEGGNVPETPEDLVRYGRVLSEAVYRLENEIERLEARLKGAQDCSSRRDVEGRALVEGRDDGGRRHFLGRRSVHAGSGLFLLTAIGWLAGRYETTWEGEPRFHFRLPGVGWEDVSIPIRSRARLAWPDEIKSE